MRGTTLGGVGEHLLDDTDENLQRKQFQGSCQGTSGKGQGHAGPPSDTPKMPPTTGSTCCNFQELMHSGAINILGVDEPF